MHQFDGIYPALLTPFRSDGSINKNALRELIKVNIQKGVDGFYACGSTSEAFLLDSNQRKELLEIVLDESKGRGKVIAHIGAISQTVAVDLAKHADSLGVDAISSIPPYYYNFPFESIFGYYKALADTVSVPLIIYHFPANSGVHFSLNHVKRLLEIEGVAGVKYTSNDFYMLSQIHYQYPQSVILNGYDEVFLSGLAAGADGGIGSTYNVMAEKFIGIKKAFQTGELINAQALQQQANEVISAFIGIGVLPAEKAALRLLGIDMGQCLKPFYQTNKEDEELIRKVLIANHCSI